MESVNIPKSLLFLPPEIRLLIYRHLLVLTERCITIREMYVPDPEGCASTWKEQAVVFFDPIQKRKVRGKLARWRPWGSEWEITTFAVENPPPSVLPLFLCNSTIYQEAARVFFGENEFRFHIADGEADWNMLYGWLEMIGRRNICQLRHLQIVYDSVDAIVHEGNQRFSLKASYDLAGERNPRSYDELLSTDWFEVISPSIERVFRKLSWSDNPLTVTMRLLDCQDMLVPRLLYPEVDLQEYDPLPLFNPFGPRETSLQEWVYDQAGARYSPKEFCMVPDLIEGYRKKYGKNTLTVQWSGRQYADEWDRTKRLLLRSGWEILRWEEKRPAPGKKPRVSFKLRLGRDLTHGRV
ncbi:hypothetical protein CFD26_106380 [Aspergillus turcosus]|uniref:F-box domain-containing protein n=1 Tax=Aspergillus turcosus TaxID=1245748 RepID=A0A421D6Q2_9EURO|nr:hypothetical protein CFD26_106380 [Aspergillus turcosus]